MWVVNNVLKLSSTLICEFVWYYFNLVNVVDSHPLLAHTKTKKQGNGDQWAASKLSI